MSLYTRKSSLESSDDRPRSSRRTRRSQAFDSEFNTNNNNAEGDAKSSLVIPDRGRRPSADSKSPSRNRKGRLVEAMTANFEKKKSADAHSASSTTTASRSIPNGDAKPALLTDPAPDDTARDVEDSTPTETTRKSGPSARRGKTHREKRQLRQKRRSTGVVNPKDIEESERKDQERADHNEEEIKLQNETHSNTQTNELSPVSTYAPVSRISMTKTDVSTARTNKSNGIHETSQISAHKSTYTAARLYASRSDEVSNSNLSGSRGEVEDLRLKVEAAELTIAKLRKEIKVMDNELHVLEEENHELKKNNKMLEDENKTMLRIFKR